MGSALLFILSFRLLMYPGGSGENRLQVVLSRFSVGVVVSVMLYPCMVCVALSIDLFVLCASCHTLFVCELFSETIRNMFRSGCYCVVEYNSCLLWLEVLCCIDHGWSSNECVCCVCDPNVRLDAPSTCLFVF